MIEEQKIGQLFFIGIGGPELDAETSELLLRVRPGGICLFARNIREARQTRDLNDSLRDLLGEDLIISLDQEGGRVDRLRRVLEPMPAASQIRTPKEAMRHAEITAEALRILGFNTNFSPVVDVDCAGRDCSANGLATRTFGTDANEVLEISSAYLQTLQSGGIQGCLKHFPGLGASVVDSHEELPEVAVDGDELRAVDLAPYRGHFAIGATRAVMVAHAVYPHLGYQCDDANGNPLPSSLNPEFINRLLRTELGFDGLVLTDDLEMGAIMRNYGIGDASIRALLAGSDQVLICNEADNILKAFEHVTTSVREGIIGPDRFEKALSRIYDFKGRISQPTEFNQERLNNLSDEIRAFKTQIAN